MNSIVADLKVERGVWLAALAFWLIAGTLACWLYPVFLADPCSRYAPMADAFAHGDFVQAFHPRFGVLFSVLAGTLSWVTGLAGIHTVQLASLMLLALAGVASFALARRLTASREIAWWTFAIIVLAPNFFVAALDGLREPAAVLAFALVGLGFATRGSGWFAAGVLIEIATFSYGFAVASLLVAGWCVWFAVRCEWKRLSLPILGWALGTGLVTVLNHAYTGWWVPVPHAISILGRWL